MAKEIERKFLVNGSGWKKAVRHSTLIEQAYLTRRGKASVRVRLSGRKAVLTIKAAGSGASRYEFEYDIPVRDARVLFQLRDGYVIKKRRYVIPQGRRRWEIDVFAGRHRGLVIAEIELGRKDERFKRPPWLGREVTGVKRYYNADLARR